MNDKNIFLFSISRLIQFEDCSAYCDWNLLIWNAYCDSNLLNSNAYDYKEESFLVSGTKKLEYMCVWEALLLEFNHADIYIENHIC